MTRNPETPALEVKAAGPFTTLQDLGRHAFQDVGVPPSGALDGISLRLANALVGNPQGCAALEIVYQGPTLEVSAEAVRVALTGTDTVLEILGEDGRSVPAWRSVMLRRGERFRVGALGDSACAYLAVAGGFAVDPCLGSLSTYVRGGFGGVDGRPLAAGDRLPLAVGDAGRQRELRVTRPPDLSLRPGERVRLVLGPQDDMFTKAAVATLFEAEFAISKESDRMGMRLDGPALAHRDGYNIVSDGIATGAIQVPGSGQPIVLLADHQTTGGYPKIATVISADLPRLGRCRPGDRVRFVETTVAEAEEARRELERRVVGLAKGLEPVSDPAPDLSSLYSQNLISGVVNAGADRD